MSASSGRSAVRLSRAAAARPYASSNGPGAGTAPRIRRPRTAATSSLAVTIRYATTVSVAARAAWVEKLACSSSPRDSTAVPSAAGDPSRRLSARAECATYSRLSTPELAGALPARNGRSPVMAGSTSVPSRAADSAAVWNSAVVIADSPGRRGRSAYRSTRANISTVTR